MRDYPKIVPVLWFIMLCLAGCGDKKTESAEDILTLSSSIAKSEGSGLQEFDYNEYSHLKVPPLEPEEALEKFKLEEGFRIEVVAHEPMVVDPIAMDIDADGRLWVIDMPAYMPVHDLDALETSALERAPAARVVVLEDSDKDGKMDIQRVFFSGLILPRAIKVLNDGILVGEPPNVWFIRDSNGDGRGDEKILVDDGFGDHTDPNIHSFPGGLMWGMDNWLHSSNNNVESIRKMNGVWKTMPFRRLGQWGMSQDNWGRLYSSNNSRPLQAHLVPYGYSSRHPHFTVEAGINVSMGGHSVWPAHPAGVNRGYRDGILRADSTLANATAASGTVIYRGDQFGEEYVGNAFSPEPGANLIKRYMIEDRPAEIEAEARYAYEGREFLTSTDERFRPVNIYNAPDGTLYVLDMYRGILEHASHLTEYLRNHAVNNDLQVPTGKYGRIYRIVREDNAVNYDSPQFSQMEPEEWVAFLSHKNGLLRDLAQQVLVQSSISDFIPKIEAIVTDKANVPYVRLQALWTLEGYDQTVYPYEDMSDLALKAMKDPHPRVRAAAIRILEQALSDKSEKVLSQMNALAEAETSPYVKLQLLASLGESDAPAALDLMAMILDKNHTSVYFREMALTGVYKREAAFAEILQNEYQWSAENEGVFSQLLSSLAEADQMNETIDISHLSVSDQELFGKGKDLFNTCGACHGVKGEGVDGVGPALEGSDWVQMDPDIPVRIVMQGFAGGVVERKENIVGVMPGHAYFTDNEVAAVLTFTRQSWGNSAVPIDPEIVTKIREKTKGRNETWTPNELRSLASETPLSTP
jgi:mono/diheme cytochrome c family protein/glucose/arabinose dehydrogenase